MPTMHVEAVEAGRHEEGRAIDVAFEGERRVDVLVGLDAGEQQAEQDGQQQAELEALAVAVDQRWCAQVTVVPEHSRISVLSSGSPTGRAPRCPWAATAPPTASTADGNSEKSKKAQNQATKNITSEAMNRIIP